MRHHPLQDRIVRRNNTKYTVFCSSKFRRNQPLHSTIANLSLFRKQVSEPEIFLTSQYLWDRKKQDKLLRHRLFQRDRFLDNNFLKISEYHNELQNEHLVYRCPFQMQWSQR